MQIAKQEQQAAAVRAAFVCVQMLSSFAVCGLWVVNFVYCVLRLWWQLRSIEAQHKQLQAQLQRLKDSKANADAEIRSA